MIYSFGVKEFAGEGFEAWINSNVPDMGNCTEWGSSEQDAWDKLRIAVRGYLKRSERARKHLNDSYLVGFLQSDKPVSYDQSAEIANGQTCISDEQLDFILTQVLLSHSHTDSDADEQPDN